MPATGSAAGPAGPQRRGPEPWRLAVAALIVATVVAAVWLWGRPHREPPGVLVAVASEPWSAGQPPGAFEVIEVAQPLAERFADLTAIAESVSSHDLPSGTFVTPELLADPAGVSGGLTAMRFEADTSAWPTAAPSAGSVAVVADVLGGCALQVTTLVDGAEGSVVVRVDAPAAARLAAAAGLDGLVVWPAPPDGWPLCRSPGATSANRVVPNPFGSGPVAPAGGG
ncbi:hypothetical protein [Candidatus Poriferisodalis sp.]|uniref:hypothetical protein n=1 Tax=Candidatus Poriferisodalis sp. TaxID=3101277 RepID=UPI003B02DC89